jgi:hypothetical protein
MASYKTTKKVVNVYLEKTTLDKVEELAKDGHRTKSGQIEHMLQAAIKIKDAE